VTFLRKKNPAESKLKTILRGQWKRRNGFIFSFALVSLLSIPFPGVFCALQVIHTQSGQVLLTFPFFLQQRFYLSYTHSIYQVPVVEEFEAKHSTIQLREISTRSWGVVEYYGIQGTLKRDRGEIRIGPLDFKLPKLSLMVGYTAEHQLALGDQTYALYKMVEPGGMLSIEVHSLSIAHYLWSYNKSSLQ
jgi:hypothetical protein